jgi:hypothetical protein
MTIRRKNPIISSTTAKKLTVVSLIMASFSFAIVNTSPQFADAHKSTDKGDVEFIRQFGTSDVDSATDVFADSPDGEYVVGFTDNTLPGQTSEGSRDAFIRKYDSDGDEIWTRQFGTSDNDEANGVSGDSSGVYVVGNTLGEFPGQTDEAGLNAFIRKYNSDGDEIWTRQFGTSLEDNVFRVSADSSGIYVVGWTRGTFEGETNEGGFDMFIRKYNSDGDEIWTRQFGTSEEFESANDVFADSSGVYVVGDTSGALPGQTAEGFTDAFIRKYNSDGDEIWTRQFGTSNPEVANGVSADSSGVYVVGLQHDNDIGFGDAFIRKYNSDGDEIWTRQFGTSDNDEARGVSADSSGVYVAGVTSGEFTGESSSGDADIFVRKYNSDGDEIWTRQFGSSELDFVGKVQGGGGISADSSGVYVAGNTIGTLPGQESEGDVDAFLAKLAIDDDKKEHDDKENHHDEDRKKKH